MNLGYSLLLGEYVKAEEIEYHDCEHWQIVCPACKEPLFKGKRETPRVTHYLSHYGKDKAYVAECEARVKSVSGKYREKINIFSRDQRLNYFLKSLREMVVESFWSDDFSYWNKETAKVRKAKALKNVRQKTLNLAKKEMKNSHCIDAVFFHYELEHSGINRKLQTSFDREKQIRIAYDFWLYLLSAKARFNFDFLFDNAWVLCLKSLIDPAFPVLSDEDREDNKRFFYPVFYGVPNSGLAGGMQLLSQMEHRNSCIIDGDTNDLIQLQRNIAEYMQRIICSLDYHKWLKRAAELSGG